MWVNAVWTDSRIFVFGACYPPSDDLYSYYPAVDRWQRIDNATGTPPTPRCGSSMVWNGQEIIIAGGGIYDGNVSYNSVFAYNPTSNAWRQLSDFPGPSRFEHVAAWLGNSMLIWGGGHPRMNTGVELY